MIIVLLGPPGAGKGTVAQRIEEKKGWPQLSSGDVLREITSSGSEQGEKLNALMKAGQLVPDETITELIKEKLTQSEFENGVILDGYPRTLNQIELLEKMLAELDKKLDMVISLDVSEEENIRRLTARTQCPKCKTVYGVDVPPKEKGVCDKCGAQLYQRKDEQVQTIKERIKVYHSATEPIIGFYREKSLLREVDANAPLEGIMKQVFSLL